MDHVRRARSHRRRWRHLIHRLAALRRPRPGRPVRPASRQCWRPGDHGHGFVARYAGRLPDARPSLRVVRRRLRCVRALGGCSCHRRIDVDAHRRPPPRDRSARRDRLHAAPDRGRATGGEPGVGRDRCSRGLAARRMARTVAAARHRTHDRCPGPHMVGERTARLLDGDLDGPRGGDHRAGRRRRSATGHRRPARRPGRSGQLDQPTPPRTTRSAVVAGCARDGQPADPIGTGRAGDRRGNRRHARVGGLHRGHRRRHR